MKKTAIVILNYNGKTFLERFLPSVISFSQNAHLVVADNASTDDSLIFLEKNYPQIQRVVLSKNHGFAKGYNLALQDIHYEYLILLNSDVQVTTDWVSSLENFMDKNPKIAACQPKIRAYHHQTHFEHAGAAGGFLDKWGFPFCRGRIFDHTEADLGQYDHNRTIFWATGACLMVRKEAFWQAGGFDEDFFAHMEEIDLCWRLQHLNHQIWVCSQATVYHVGGGTLQTGSPFKTFLNFRNNLLMLLKNYPKNGLALFAFIFWRLCLDGLAGTKFFLDGKFAHTWAIVRSHWAFYAQIPKTLRKRSQIRPKKMPDTVFQKSIVWEYFVTKKRLFSDLNF